MIFIGIGLVCIAIALIVGVRVDVRYSPPISTPARTLTVKEIKKYNGDDMPDEEKLKYVVPE